MRAVDLRLGIDVGGTNTDAVVLDQANRVIAKAKTPTTREVGDGIEHAIREVLSRAPGAAGRITHAMLGTTHATNAVLRREPLGRVAVIRVAGPASYSVPQFTGWPSDLRDAVNAGSIVIDGQIEYDGREDRPLDREALRGFLTSLGPVDAFAITGVFSPVSTIHEDEAASLVREVWDDVPVVLSHEMGTIGILDRENSTILNAALIGLVDSVADGFVSSLAAHQVRAECFLAQNDGTLMGLDHARSHPVLTIGSGPANSLRGAAHLSGLEDCIVLDIGGTSTDVGAILHSFPRLSAIPIDVGGVRTNFRMPDLISVALGGGSVLEEHEDSTRITAKSLGYLIRDQALSFGGSIPTLTDAAVALGRMDPPSDDQASALDAKAAAGVIEAFDDEVKDVIDRMKASKRTEPLVVVGGAAAIVADTIAGVSEVRRPEHYEVANAVGAALATVSATVDRLYSLDGRDHDDVIESARREALDEVVRRGGNANETHIVDIDEIRLSYLAANVVRVRVKAAGPLVGMEGNGR